MNKISFKWFLRNIITSAPVLSLGLYSACVYSASEIHEPVQACVLAYDAHLSKTTRSQLAQCLGWHTDQSIPVCRGFYQAATVAPLADPKEIRIMADRASFHQNQPSVLRGNVEVQYEQRIVNAQTAYVSRDAKTNQITKIEFLGNVRYLEPDRLVIARQAVLNPQDKSGQTVDVLYRFNVNRHQALLPAWGRASFMQRFTNSDYLMRHASYTTCAPQDKAWEIQAQSIAINNQKKVGVARNVTLRVRDWPIVYVPYLTFPTGKERKSGFLMPLVGYTNISGFDFGLPYYLNLAPNYDLIVTPHVYTERGVMLGGAFRYLTAHSMGKITGDFLPQDAKYRNLLENNGFYNQSINRWHYKILDTTQFNPDLRLNLNLQHVSDSNYFKDFSINLASITQRQLVNQADLTYSTEHWTLKGMAQGFQTLQPIGEPLVLDQYRRLPQLYARAYYYELPLHANVDMLGQYDQFFWPTHAIFPEKNPQGPRFHLNPMLTLPQQTSWGFITPSVDLVENYYQVEHNNVFPFSPEPDYLLHNNIHAAYNRFIPRADVRGGLFFERDFRWSKHLFQQTLEPSLFYLYVPFVNQSQLPIYDTGNMIFNFDQLFRTNRFSGFDRIGDANQLTYALTSRWLSATSGKEIASFSVGQIKYFTDRKVQLCRSPIGNCAVNNASYATGLYQYEIGQLSPTYPLSPIASRAAYRVDPYWTITGDYMWDPAISETNNGDLNIHYQPEVNKLINFGYSYLLYGEVNKERHELVNGKALHQAIVSMAWPVTSRWSTLGAYSQNISEGYSMMSLLGLQYDNCCWAIRLLGGRTFDHLDPKNMTNPIYNHNVYFQILLKGLGSVSTTDPSSALRTYVPGYYDTFH